MTQAWRVGWQLAALLLAVLLTWGWWRLIGPVAIVAGAPLAGLVLVWPLLAAAGGGVRLARWLAWRSAEGRHYVFHGQPFDIVEDAAGARWLLLSDVRRVLPGLPADAVLQRLHPDGVGPWDHGGGPWRIEADALIALLAKAHDAGAIRFKTWLDREVSLPVRRRRERRL